MADLRDEEGNPIQLTDEHGNPVQLTDEHGNPMHLTGIATSPGSALRPVGPAAPTYTHTTPEETGLHDPTPVPHTIPDYSADSGPIPVTQTETKTGVGGEQLHRSSSSSSSSSEDDGQGGRRKKGLKEKIKERFSGGKHKDTQTATTVTTINTEHEKKSLAEKIKEKLPGHHAH